MGAERYANWHQPARELERIRDAKVQSLHFTLLFPHGELGWHLTDRYQGDATSHNYRISFPNLPHTHTASSPVCTRCSFVLQDSTLITEMSVPSFPVSPGPRKLVLSLLPVCYSHKYSSKKPHAKTIMITVWVMSTRNS